LLICKKIILAQSFSYKNIYGLLVLGRKEGRIQCFQGRKVNVIFQV
jgi:hypothetical protein